MPAMPVKRKLTTTVSTKKAAPAFAPTRPKDVFGSLPYKGPAKSIEDMKAVTAANALGGIKVRTP
jgi:hypothetical protein